MSPSVHHHPQSSAAVWNSSKSAVWLLLLHLKHTPGLRPLISSIASLFHFYPSIWVCTMQQGSWIFLPLVNFTSLWTSYMLRHRQPLGSFHSHNQSGQSDVISATHGGYTHRSFYLFISSLCHCRCFCWDANKLAHLAAENEEAQQMHMAKLSSFINPSMFFQFPPVKRLYRNNYWGK